MPNGSYDSRPLVEVKITHRHERVTHPTTAVNRLIADHIHKKLQGNPSSLTDADLQKAALADHRSGRKRVRRRRRRRQKRVVVYEL